MSDWNLCAASASGFGRGTNRRSARLIEYLGTFYRRTSHVKFFSGFDAAVVHYVGLYGATVL